MQSKTKEPFSSFEYEIDKGKTINFFPDIYADAEENESFTNYNYTAGSIKVEQENNSDVTTTEIKIEKVENNVEKNKKDQSEYDKPDGLKRYAQKVLAQAENNSSASSEEDKFEEIREDLIEVLSELDKLFVNLPEDIVKKFARSQVYEKYNYILDVFWFVGNHYLD